jgi:hypothetical protein
MEKRKISCPYWESNPGCQAGSPYLLNYPIWPLYLLKYVTKVKLENRKSGKFWG